MREDLPKCLRICLKKEIEVLKGSDKRLNGKYVIIVYRKNGLSYSRLLVVVSSRIGNAVMRNRVKRLIREVFRKRLKVIPGFDFMIIARVSSRDCGYRDIEGDILSLVKDLGETN